MSIDSHIEHLKHLLLQQGPLHEFIHHNPLHGFQDETFFAGIEKAARFFGAKRTLDARLYLELLRKNSITDLGIREAQKNFPQFNTLTKIPELIAFVELHQREIDVYARAERETAIRASWRTDYKFNLDLEVNPILFKWVSSFMDQGISYFAFPSHESLSFWECLRQLVNTSKVSLSPALSNDELKRFFNLSVEEALGVALSELCEPEASEDYITERALATPGWTGVLTEIELQNRPLFSRRILPLKQFLAFGLVLEVALLKKKVGAFRKRARVLNKTTASTTPQFRDFFAFFTEALEQSFHAPLLKGIRLGEAPTSSARSKYQLVFCIDDREGSMRDYIEAQSPEIETFGTAGFFGMDFLYQGPEDASPAQYCPVVLKPTTVIVGEYETDPESREIRVDIKKFFKGVFRPQQSYVGLEWIYSHFFGVFALFRLLISSFFPHQHQLTEGSIFQVAKRTKLSLRKDAVFSKQDAADKITGLLRNIGLTKNFGKQIILVSHGATSTSNPYFAAYDCGACAGRPGAVNARIFAQFANDPEVRFLLQSKQIFIPDDCRFYGAFHDTTRDEVLIFDRDRAYDFKYSKNINPDLVQLNQYFTRALDLNALERCQKFELAPDKLSAAQAHDHVIRRSISIFEPRPEYNHATNAAMLIGPRCLSEHVALDRRVFLSSYSPEADPDGVILKRTLQAVVPVTGGINLEYYFSRFDQSTYGAGSKLAHNLIGLIGVSNGVEGDLLLGLPSQMVEIHDPMRLLMIVNQRIDVVKNLFATSPEFDSWLNRGWMKFACLDSQTQKRWVFANGEWKEVL